MKNVDYEVQGDKLTIQIDLGEEFGPSRTGKTIIIASTEGNAKIEREGESPIFLGLNVYRKR